MADSSADLYDEQYYRHYCGELPYERSDGWLNVFGGIADRIIQTIGPRSVLDAGCALGCLSRAFVIAASMRTASTFPSTQSARSVPTSLPTRGAD